MNKIHHLFFAFFVKNKRKLHYWPILFVFCFFKNCTLKEVPVKQRNIARASETLDSIFAHYKGPKANIFLEDFYLDKKAPTEYLYAHLCPYLGYFSSVNALIAATDQEKYKSMLTSSVLPGLDEYFDNQRVPFGYAAYFKDSTQELFDRFYDDNIGAGLYYLEAYEAFKKPEYLNEAKLIWKFVEGGVDDKLGGGIYWCEQDKASKNTCANVSGILLALKLYQVTKDSTYYIQGKKWYDWTLKNLQDKTDHLFYDCIRLDGSLVKKKFSYNSSQVMQSSVLFFKMTGDSTYLAEAKIIAQSCYQFFFFDYQTPKNDKITLMKKGSVWFSAIMLRGYIELYKVDGNRLYIDAYQQNLDYVWAHCRDKHGLFSTDWTGRKVDYRKWVLTQLAFVEMYARMSLIEPVSR